MAPSSIAFFGGKSIVGAVKRCRHGGFQGDIWLVNPKHNEIVFVVQNLINKVNDCDCRKEKVRYCTKIFNYLLENNFVLESRFKFPFTTWEDRIYLNNNESR